MNNESAVHPLNPKKLLNKSVTFEKGNRMCRLLPVDCLCPCNRSELLSLCTVIFVSRIPDTPVDKH